MMQKPLFWLGDARKTVQGFPSEARQVFGYGLHLAQTGGKHPAAKPLRGFHGSGVLEIVEDFDGDTYRAVYTVKLAGAVYVLHAFKKKAKKGIATPQREIGVIKKRLKQAREHHGDWSAAGGLDEGLS